MRLKEWSASAALVKEAREKIQSQVVWKQIVEVLEAEHPCRLDLPYTAAAEHRAAYQARTAGYQKALDVLTGIFQLVDRTTPVEDKPYQRPVKPQPKDKK